MVLQIHDNRLVILVIEIGPRDSINRTFQGGRARPLLFFRRKHRRSTGIACETNIRAPRATLLVQSGTGNDGDLKQEVTPSPERKFRFATMPRPGAAIIRRIPKVPKSFFFRDLLIRIVVRAHGRQCTA